MWRAATNHSVALLKAAWWQTSRIPATECSTLNRATRMSLSLLALVRAMAVSGRPSVTTFWGQDTITDSPSPASQSWPRLSSAWTSGCTGLVGDTVFIADYEVFDSVPKSSTWLWMVSQSQAPASLLR